jgi:hypothetical protein
LIQVHDDELPEAESYESAFKKIYELAIGYYFCETMKIK